MRQLVNPATFGRACIGLSRHGCRHRPFYHITVYPDRALGRRFGDNKIEDLGSFDPIPNDRGEKLVAIKFDRIKYWLGVRNAYVSTPVLELLGLSGLLPIHPKTILRARTHRKLIGETFEVGQWQKKLDITSDIDVEQKENMEEIITETEEIADSEANNDESAAKIHPSSNPKMHSPESN